MIQRTLLSVVGTLLGLSLMLLAPCLAAGEAPPEASVDGKYSELLQILTCPTDVASYGQFRDYGHWGGGSWCGQRGKAGYWVWVAPNWYIWKHKGRTPVTSVPAFDNVPPDATVNGKYSNHIQTLHCPKDVSSYGQFRDYGHWGGGSWCGKKGKAGYWVWVAPNWYIFATQN